MREKNYRGAAIHNVELNPKRKNPKKSSDFDFTPKSQIRNFEICEENDDGTYQCRYTNVFQSLSVPIDGNALTQSNIEMAEYLYQLEHGSNGTLSVVCADDSEEESSEERK